MSLSSFIWSVADLLRGDYKQSEYGKVILPFTVLRRMDCVLEKTKESRAGGVRSTRKSAGINPSPSCSARPSRASTTRRPWT
jgi:type I restriction enzyme M protein